MLDEIREKVKRSFEGRDPAHDFQHVLRVYQNAELIGRQEGADMQVLLAAALMHDLVLYPKGSAKRSKSADDSADAAEKILQGLRCPREKIDRICYCIRMHSYSKGLVPETLEGRVLQDADRLDALGAIGIARTFSVGGSEGRLFYNPQDPLCKTRQPDDLQWTLDHFRKKLLKLEGSMHTEAGRKIARERTRFMEQFLGQLEKEI